MPRRRCRAAKPAWTKKACAEKIKISDHSRIGPPIAPFGRRTTGTTLNAAAAPVNFFRGWDADAGTGSEPRQIRKSKLATMHVDAPEFGAAVQDRKHLSGIEQALRVEGAFQPLLLVEI